MPTPTDIWPREAHTEAKHRILDAYLSAWFPKLAQTSSFTTTGITYVDAFSGPGEYAAGEKGSPQIALDRATAAANLNSNMEVRCLFIEKLPKFAQHLSNLIDIRYPQHRRPTNLTVKVHQGDCHDLLIPALRDINGEGGPIFVNFDGWGVDLNASLVRHIGKRRPSPEVFVFFNASMFIRQATNDLDAADRLFGGRAWRSTITRLDDPDDKKRTLVELYRNVLVDAGFTHTIPFELVTADGNKYILFFGTTHEEGVNVMKDAMWGVDTYAGSRFRDPRTTGQVPFALELKPDLDTLADIIYTHVEGCGPATLTDLQRFTLLETIYRKAHTRPATDILVDRGRCHIGAGRSYEEKMVTISSRLFYDT